MWEPRRPTTLLAFMACYRDSFTFFFFTFCRIATDCRLDGSGSDSSPRPTEPPIQWVLGALSPGAKRQRREADHSPPSCAEVKNGGAMPPLSHMPSRHRDNFSIFVFSETGSFTRITTTHDIDWRIHHMFNVIRQTSYETLLQWFWMTLTHHLFLRIITKWIYFWNIGGKSDSTDQLIDILKNSQEVHGFSELFYFYPPD
jgi:hypothetical protein